MNMDDLAHRNDRKSKIKYKSLTDEELKELEKVAGHVSYSVTIEQVKRKAGINESYMKQKRLIREHRGIPSTPNDITKTELIKEIDNIDYNNLDKIEVKILKSKMNYVPTRLNIQEESLTLERQKSREAEMKFEVGKIYRVEAPMTYGNADIRAVWQMY